MKKAQMDALLMASEQEPSEVIYCDTDSIKVNEVKESQNGTNKVQDLFAEQYKVMNMLDKDYGIRSVYLASLVSDILDRVYSGEKIVDIDSNKMMHYHGASIIPERGN